MVIRARFWVSLVTIPILALVISDTALSQDQQAKPEGGHRLAPEPEEATHFNYAKRRSFPNVFSPYTSAYVPAPRLDNSPRLRNLITDGKLALSLDDAIALALENNLEIAVARYNLPVAQTDLLRAKGGGAARGVAGSFQSNTIFSGSLGGGLNSGGVGGGRGAGGILGGGINGVGSAGCCDPSFYASYGWSNAITPLNYTVVSGVAIESTHQASVSAGYSQGFLTGTSFAISESSSRLSSNTTTELFNPDFVSSLSFGVSQNLLRGFGTRANAIFIRQARNNLKYSESVFRQNVITEVAAVITAYYGH